MQKKFFLVSLVLGSIALVCAFLIAGMNMLTAGIIESNNTTKENEAYSLIFADYASSEKKDITLNTKGYIQSKYLAKDKNDTEIGYIYKVSGSNSYGKITLMVGIKNNTVVDVEFIENTESFGSTVNDQLKNNYPSSKENVVNVTPYGQPVVPEIGALDQAALENIEVKCGATYGATLVKELVTAALNDAKGAN